MFTKIRLHLFYPCIHTDVRLRVCIWCICWCSLPHCGVTGDYKFVSATYRLFKVPKGNTKPCQVIYNGAITGSEESLEFDCHYTFKVRRPLNQSNLIWCNMCKNWLFVLSSTEKWSGHGWWGGCHYFEPDKVQRGLHLPATRRHLRALRRP